jgi:hypothetical protein
VTVLWLGLVAFSVFGSLDRAALAALALAHHANGAGNEAGKWAIESKKLRNQSHWTCRT